jgi:hypothetical protein
MYKSIKNQLPVGVKDSIKKTVSIGSRIAKYGINYRAQSSNTNITILSDSDRPTFFGYHDKTPFSADESKILAMSITASDTRADSECTPMRIGYFPRRANGEYENRFIPLTETTIWVLAARMYASLPAAPLEYRDTESLL